MPKPSNRGKILSVGVGLMHERGYASTSVRDIVQAAGVPQGCFTNHFPTKEAFGVEVINQHFAGALESLNRTLCNVELPPLKRLEAYFDAAIDQLRGGRAGKGCLFGNFGIEASPLSEIIRQRIVAVFAELERAIRLCLEAAVQSKDLPADYNCKEMSEFILSTVQGATLLAKAKRSPSPVEAAKRIVFSEIFAASGRLQIHS